MSDDPYHPPARAPLAIGQRALIAGFDRDGAWTAEGRPATIEASLREGLSTPEEVSAVFAALWGELGECGEEEALHRLAVLRVRLSYARYTLLEGRRARQATGMEAATDHDGDGNGERPLRRFEVRLVRSAVDIETGTAVVEGEDEEDAREWAVENVCDFEGLVEWRHARRKHEEVEVEDVREVPPDTPLTAPPEEEG